jgi:ABC-type glycerol-3-phosphate transport system permease component
MAGTIMATIPVILIFILAQKRIIEGVAFTGITS